MATMTIGMLSMMVQETEQEPVFMGPTLDDVEALQRANSVALAMDEADFVQTTLQAVQPMVDSGDLKAATEHMINSLRDRIGLRGHVAMEGIGSFIASVGSAIATGIKKLIEAIINACKAIGRFIAGLFGGKEKQDTDEKIKEIEEKSKKESEKHEKLRQDLEKARAENRENLKKTLDELKLRASKDEGGEKSGGQNQYEGPALIKKIRELKEKQNGTKNAEDAKVVKKDPQSLPAPKKGPTLEEAINELSTELKEMEDRVYPDKVIQEFIEKHMDGKTKGIPPYLYFAEHIVNKGAAGPLTQSFESIAEFIRDFGWYDYSKNEDFNIATGAKEITADQVWTLKETNENEGYDNPENKYRVSGNRFHPDRLKKLIDPIKEIVHADVLGSASPAELVGKILTGVNRNVLQKKKVIQTYLGHLPDSEENGKLHIRFQHMTSTLMDSMAAAEKRVTKLEEWVAKTKAAGDPILEAENHLKNIRAVILSIQEDQTTLLRALAAYHKCDKAVKSSVTLIDHAVSFTAKANYDEMERVKYG